MAQGDDKTGQKGTNLVFVMTHPEAKIDVAMRKAGRKWTYARVVVNYRPKKRTQIGYALPLVAT
jgi:hypothetical protein